MISGIDLESLEPNSACPPVFVHVLVGLLDQLRDLLFHLQDVQYNQKPIGVVKSSIGSHIRHNLDHFEAFIQGLSSGRINYDHRERGTAVEKNRQAAQEAIDRIRYQLNEINWGDVPDCLGITSLISPDSPPIESWSSVEREAGFVISHTIHHNALIGVMLKMIGIQTPESFGYAPSTIAFQRSKSCVR